MSKKAYMWSFTLLELLVVIGIIGILLGLGSVSYSTAQKKARDARRNGDLKTAQHTMEQCFSGVGNYQYPLLTPAAGNSGTVSTSCTVNGTAVTFSIADPVDVTPNLYTVVSTSTSTYEIQATLENGTTTSVKAQQ